MHLDMSFCKDQFLVGHLAIVHTLFENDINKTQLTIFLKYTLQIGFSASMRQFVRNAAYSLFILGFCKLSFV